MNTPRPLLLSCSLLALALAACSTPPVDPRVLELREQGRMHREVEDWSPALEAYTELTRLEERDSPAWARALHYKAVSELQAGEIYAAENTLDFLAQSLAEEEGDELLDAELRREHRRLRGECALSRAQDVDPVFEDGERPSHELNRRRRAAASRYRKALEELEGGDPGRAGALCKAEALIRIGILEENPQSFYLADDLLRPSFEAVDRDEVKDSEWVARIQRLRGLLASLKGGAEMNGQGAETLVHALSMDERAQMRCHLLYRDVLVFLRRFRNVHDVASEFERDPGGKLPDEPSLLQRRQVQQAHVEAMIQAVRRYYLTGRGQQAPAHLGLHEALGEFFSTFDGFEWNEAGSVDRINAANDRAAVQSGIAYLSNLRAAYSELLRIEPQYRSSDFYKEVYARVVENFAGRLRDEAEALLAVGEIERPRKYCAEAISLYEAVATTKNRPFDDKTVLEQLEEKLDPINKIIRGLDSAVELMSDWKLAETQIRSSLEIAAFREARSILQAARTPSALTNGWVQERITGYEQVLSQAEDTARYEELRTLWARVSSESDAELALAALEADAPREVDENDRVAAFWLGRFLRRKAQLQFQLERFAQCQTTLERLTENKIPLEIDDRILIGHCHHALDEPDRAGSIYGAADVYPVLAQESDLLRAAETFLDLDRPGDARPLLEKCGPHSTTANDLRSRCCRALLQALPPGASPAQRIELLRQQIAASPRNADARYQLSRLLHDRGIAHKNPSEVEAAWKELCAARELGFRVPAGEGFVNALHSMHADYLPMGPGDAWRFVGEDGQSSARFDAVEKEGDALLVRCRIQIGNDEPIEVDERWKLNGRTLERRIATESLHHHLPVGEHWVGPDWDEKKIARTWAQQVMECRCWIEDNALLWEGPDRSFQHCLLVHLDEEVGSTLRYVFAPETGLVEFQERGQTFRRVFAESGSGSS